MGVGDGYQWGQSKWKGSQSSRPHSSAAHGEDDSETQKSGPSAGSKGPPAVNSAAVGGAQSGSERAGCRSGFVVIVGTGEQSKASRDSTTSTSAENSWAVAKLCSPCFGENLNGFVPVGCFLALGFLSRDPVGRPTLTGCR